MDRWMIDRLASFVEWEGSLEWALVPLSPQVAEGLPETWRKALSNATVQRERLAALWGPLAGKLPRAFDVFGRKLAGLAVLRTAQRPASLVYVFQDGGEDVTAVRGFLPAKSPSPLASALPMELQLLQAVHDGLVHFISYDGGPLPCAEWTQIGDASTGEPCLLKIAMNGSEAFGFDTSEQPPQAYRVLPDEDGVEPVADVWAYLDELIVGNVPSRDG